MKIQKQARRKPDKRPEDQVRTKGAYVCFRPHNKALFLNCEVRDAILPRNYAAIEILNNLDFVIYPTDDETEYKISITAGMALISGNKFADYYKPGIHISAEVREDGTILCKANEGGAVA